MKITQLPIQGALAITLDKFIDDRGFFVKTFNRDLFNKTPLSSFESEEEFYTLSHKNVIRGLHFQSPPFDHNKIVTCISGCITDVLLDLRLGSPTYGKSYNINLDSCEDKIVFIPKGLAHGFVAREDNSIVTYKVDKKYSPKHDKGVLWESIDFDWQVENPVISERDQGFSPLLEFETPFK